MSDDKKVVIVVDVPESGIAKDLPPNTPKIIVTSGTK